jgi:hypothetical protein
LFEVANTAAAAAAAAIPAQFSVNTKFMFLLIMLRGSLRKELQSVLEAAAANLCSPPAICYHTEAVTIKR